MGDNATWGRRKKELVISIQGDLTEKQFEAVVRRMLKIAEKYDLGLAATNVWDDADVIF